MAASDPKPRRHWFRYSLRTMFVVVTVFAVWLGWEVKYIRERQAFIQRVTGCGNHCILVSDALVSVLPQAVPAPTIPFWRRWLGDRAVAIVGFPLRETNPAKWDADRVREFNDDCRRLFPEAVEFLRVAGGV